MRFGVWQRQRQRLVAQSNWSQPVYPKDIETPRDPALPAKYTDEAVLSIVVQDYMRASAWLEDRRWPLQWTESDVLYQSPRMLSVFESSTVTRANVSRFSVAKQVNSLAPAIAGAIFFNDATPFEIRPRPSSHQDTARAWKELIAELLDQIHFKQELSYGIQGMVNQGTVIFKGGWETVTEVETHYRRKEAPLTQEMPFGKPSTIFTEASDEFEAIDIEVTRNRPTFEKCELGTVFVDPTWNSPNQLWKAKWIVHEMYLDYDDLTKLRDNPDYDIPSDDELRAIFMSDAEVTEGISADRTGDDAQTPASTMPSVRIWNGQKTRSKSRCRFWNGGTEPRSASSSRKKSSSATASTSWARSLSGPRTTGTLTTQGMVWALAASPERPTSRTGDVKCAAGYSGLRRTAGVCRGARSQRPHAGPTATPGWYPHGGRQRRHQSHRACAAAAGPARCMARHSIRRRIERGSHRSGSSHRTRFNPREGIEHCAERDRSGDCGPSLYDSPTVPG